MSQEVERINYEYRRRDLQEKYSYAVSRLGTCEPEKKAFWREQLDKVSAAQAVLKPPAV